MEKAKNLASKGQHQMKVLITFADTTTVAQLLKGDKTVKTANAYCAPVEKKGPSLKELQEKAVQNPNDVIMNIFQEPCNLASELRWFTGLPVDGSRRAVGARVYTQSIVADINKRAEERKAKMAEEKRLENATMLIRKIADHYGLNNQKLKLQEELGELITASAKPDIDHVVEEMADVSIMIEQVVYLLKKESLFAETREKKIGRQIKRIEEERYCFVCKNLPIASYKEPCKSCLCEHNRPNWERK